ncbi:hypothetical protein CWO92_07915 [Heyndrickxia camelliae]|uniref:Uncharacterized protein n=1 Tax=Heyndrickxia camelliae TaxID=1707093 RepID=A0A2N3LM03_9BACI|nr:hypothetical protein CWO92_07915 [Heyndrickxia camelliae]
MLIFFLFVIPSLGVLLFLTFTSFLKNLKDGKSTYNQTILGAILTFIFLFALMYGFVAVH